ncbi:MAG TPA: helix-turn-helix domain-containing protein [Firmicutes bacterium]|nr:helix-turn-helix domain-containing protein [Bacillota bacterium]
MKWGEDMSGIGQELREARERLGLTVDNITERTMIPKKYLLALEEENYKVFPGEVYLKGALRTYATELGLDAREMLDLYHRSTHTATEEPAAAPRVVKKRKRRKIKIFKSLTATVLVLLLAGCTYLLVRFINDRFLQADPPPVVEEEPEPQNSEPPSPQEEEPDLPVPEEVTVERDTTSTEIRYLVRNAETLEADMSFSGPCWISVHTDGQETFQGTLQQGQARAAAAAQELRIRIGNPNAFTLSVCGQQVDLPDMQRAYTLFIVRE